MAWPKGVPRKTAPAPSAQIEVSTSVEEARRANDDPNTLKQKLDYFQYTQDENARNIWEFGGDISPMDLPPGLQKKYPQLRFHWCSKAKWDRYGHNYGGWQRFTDGDHRDGVTRGNDLFLAAMPEEAARKREKWVSDRSTSAVRAVQERSIQTIDQIQAMGGEAIGGEGKAAGGIAIGERAKVGMTAGGKVLHGGGGHRGYSPAELADLARKQKEDRDKNRVTSTS